MLSERAQQQKPIIKELNKYERKYYHSSNENEFLMLYCLMIHTTFGKELKQTNAFKKAKKHNFS